MAAHSKSKDGSSVKDDAAQIADDLTQLTEDISELGTEKAKYLTEELVRRFEDQIDELSARLADLTKNAKVHAEQVDQHIKTNPYLYLLGAAGVGFFLGKTLPGLKRS